MFRELEKIFHRPEPFQFYTAEELWTGDHTSKRMLDFHLNPEINVSSRRIQFIEDSVAWIVSRFQIGPNTRIADFGCGPGLYTNRLATVGAHVTGIDFSPRSINHARAVAKDQGLAVEYHNQDYLDFETDERFELIIMIMCDFCALSPAQRKKMLTKFARLLAPGGSVLMDVYSTMAFAKREETVSCEENLLNGFWSPDKYFGFLRTFKYEEEKVILDKYTIVDPKGTRTVYNWLQYYTKESLQREFQDGGFSRCKFFGDVSGIDYSDSLSEFAVVATRN